VVTAGAVLLVHRVALIEVQAVQVDGRLLGVDDLGRGGRRLQGIAGEGRRVTRGGAERHRVGAGGEFDEDTAVGGRVDGLVPGGSQRAAGQEHGDRTHPLRVRAGELVGGAVAVDGQCEESLGGVDDLVDRVELGRVRDFAGAVVQVTTTLATSTCGWLPVMHKLVPEVSAQFSSVVTP